MSIFFYFFYTFSHQIDITDVKPVFLASSLPHVLHHMYRFKNTAINTKSSLSHYGTREKSLVTAMCSLRASALYLQSPLIIGEVL